MSDHLLVSVILPFYNSAKFLTDAIQSVLSQDHQYIELITINDGSTDDSKKIALSFSDARIRYLEQANRGVSAARNLGLSQMSGTFFCFLDADDVMPKHAISSRIKLFANNPEINFVDGVVRYVDQSLNPLDKVYRPGYSGKPLSRLLQLDSQCFVGNTWMIRKNRQLTYAFNEDISHGEDLLFYISICRQQDGQYAFVTEDVLLYRQTENSAMSNLRGLEEGYLYLIRYVNQHVEGRRMIKWLLRLKIIKAMFLSHLFNGKDLRAAIVSVFTLFRG